MPASTGPVPARLFVILARRAPVGVIFRRGPSKLVELIRWDTATDTFERGQWFKGRIYEYCSDLSPDGSLLIYYATKMQPHDQRDPEQYRTWTAISKPPWLTALALWPAGDSVWPEGGGLFLDGKSVWLSHSSAGLPAKGVKPQDLQLITSPEMKPPPKREFPRPFGSDGWVLVRSSRPHLWEKCVGASPWAIAAEGPRESWLRDCTYCSYTVVPGPAVPGPASVTIDLGRAIWADWDQQERLVFARDGKLFAGEIDAAGQLSERELADFDADTFEAKQAPAWAREW
jgi:hypothetical protein